MIVPHPNQQAIIVSLQPPLYVPRSECDPTEKITREVMAIIHPALVKECPSYLPLNIHTSRSMIAERLYGIHSHSIENPHRWSLLAVGSFLSLDFLSIHVFQYVYRRLRTLFWGPVTISQLLLTGSPNN